MQFLLPRFAAELPLTLRPGQIAQCDEGTHRREVNFLRQRIASEISLRVRQHCFGIALHFVPNDEPTQHVEI